MRGGLAALLFSGSLVVWASAASADFSYRVDLLAIGEYYNAATDSPVNIGPVRQDSRVRAIADLRPDLKWQSDRWLLIAKPRAEAGYTRFTGAAAARRDDRDTDVFVHEALLRFSPARGLFLSAGRENLQWGPSYLVSSSNPFNRDNGRNNPLTEVAGLDYAKLSWLPSSHWNISAIANVARGELEYGGDYPRQYALKFDYNGASKYFSLIPSWRESASAGQSSEDSSEDYRLGAYAGWTASEALLLYAEGAYHQLEDAYAALAGMAYTFESGTNVAMEYFHNSAGCTFKPFLRCFISGLPASLDLSQPGFIRKNYVLLQLLDQNRYKRWNFTLRWIAGLDDQSSALIGIADYDVSPSAKLSFIGSAFYGDEQSEYRSLLHAFASVGLRYSF